MLFDYSGLRAFVAGIRFVGEIMVFPIGDDNTQRRTVPIVTYAFILINIAVFLLELNRGNAFIREWAFIPGQFSNNPVGEAQTILTAMFMHGGWMHLIGNMLYLWIFGDNVEDNFGSVKFALFYLLSGVVATFAQLAIMPNSSIPNLGASGAIAGVLAAYLVLYPQGRVTVLTGMGMMQLPALLVIGFWIVFQLFSGIGSIATTSQTAETGGVAYMAHIGGFFGGLLLAFFFRESRRV